jgi:hypothetical protein
MNTQTEFKVERGIPVPTTSLEPNPWNPNQTSDRVQKAIGESLSTYGQVLEILVRPHPEKKNKYQIIDGAHRYEELKDSTENVFVNIIHGLSDADAKKLTITVNETRGNADKIELAKLLAEIQLDLGDDLGIGLPYEPEELKELVNLASVDWDNFGPDFDDTQEDSSSESDLDSKQSDYLTIEIKISQQDFDDYWKSAYNTVADSMQLSKNTEIAAGEVLTVLAKEYIGV